MNLDFQQIIVEQIRVRDRITGSGATQDLDPDPEFSLGSNLSANDIAETVNSLADFANIRQDRFEMVYRMKVLAPTKRGAKRRARAFARAKNPFEPRLYIVDVTNKEETDDGNVQPMFSVKVQVWKR